MKCPHCWTEKGYLREVEGWKGFLLELLLLRPMHCEHCYHDFIVLWISTLGKKITRTKASISVWDSRGTSSSSVRHGAARTALPQSGAVDPGSHRRTTWVVRASRDANFKKAA
ncbi:MAG: hypothetical protein WCJ35_06910 [Planctomycetota bacterium]